MKLKSLLLFIIFVLSSCKPPTGGSGQGNSSGGGSGNQGSTAPDTFLSTLTSSSTTETSAEFTFSSNNLQATFECRVDSGSFATCTSPVQLSGLSLGAHTFEVRALVGGAADATPASFQWTITSSPTPSPPETFLSTSTTSPTTDTSAEFTFSSNLSATFECRIDAGSFTACTSPRQFTSLSLGAHTFEVRATSGGVTDATPASFQWTIEAPGPAAFGLTNRVEFAGSTFPTGLAEPALLDIEDVFPGMNNISNTLYVTAAPGEADRLYLLNREGLVQYVNTTGTPSLTTLLDISGPVITTQECGMLGLAFDPNYSINHYYYVFYVYDNAGTITSRVSRFTSTDATDTETVILDIPQASGIHKGGMLAFGPDGMLYISLGESGVASNSQDRSNLLGKLLRINVSQLPYTIPADNPFVGQSGIREEIWAYGLRNPWRFSFDRDTGTLWLADVGEEAQEEVNIIIKGGNYGWAFYEGAAQRQPGLNAANVIGPIYTYPNPVGSPASITGGYVYRGNEIPSLRGSYVFVDLIVADVSAFTFTGDPTDPPTQQEVMSSGTPIQSGDVTIVANTVAGNPVSFGEDNDGELYLTSLNGGGVEVVRFEEQASTPVQPTLPELLSETGLFTNVETLEPAPGLIEFDVNSPLWSDSALKRRWIALPGDEQIVFSPDGNWEFPEGTIFVKHFELQVNPSTTTRLETRVLISDASGWQGYTYRWNDAEDDAELLVSGETEVITTASGDQLWQYPSRAQCLVCHTSGMGRILGARTNQLNKDFDFTNATDNQLRAWNHISLFTTDIAVEEPEDAEQYDALVNPRDTALPIYSRVRSYLAANCAQCHFPGGPTPADIDLRIDTALDDMGIKDVDPLVGNAGLDDLNDPKIVKSLDSANSVLRHRMNQRIADDEDNVYQMPPLGTNLIDEEIVDLIGEWIDAGATE